MTLEYQKSLGNVVSGSTGTGQMQTGSSGSSWWKKYKYNSENPWEDALSNAYSAVSAAGESTGSGQYTSDWDQAVADAQELTGKDYGDELNQLAQDEIDAEKTDYGNELGKLGMRELQFQTDVVDDWTDRRTKASTQAEIDAQEMQTAALSTLDSLLESASSYEISQMEADLASAKALVEAASAGSSANQDWEEFITSILATYDT